MAEDLEEYQTTLYTSPDCSATSLPPPLETTPSSGSVHSSPDLYQTVVESMKQAVPLDIKASTIGTKKSGLFYAGQEPLARGEMLFLTSPLAMARSPDEDQIRPPPSHGGPMRDTDMCDYCFKGLRTFAEAGGGGRGRRHAAAQRCTGCNLLSFCDKVCHHKAWKHFHKLECRILKRVQRRDAVFLLHLRILLMDKAGHVPENIVSVVRNMNDPFSIPAKLPPAEDVKNCALQAYHLLSLEHRDFFFVRDVLCRILGNQAVVATADETAIVHCFDVALAMLNHSCEPNAFVFVEGRQARVRSVRSIQPGEEITVSLVDTRLDVYNRHDVLKTVAWNDDYVCRCDECDRDQHRIAMMTHGDGSQEAALRTYHKDVIPKAKLLMLKFKNAVWESRKADVARGFVELADGEFVARFGKDMPMHIADCKPIPWLRMAGASMFLEMQDLENALYYAVMSFMLHERHFGPEAVADMRIFVNTLKAVCELPATSTLYRNFFAEHGDGQPSVFPTRQELGALTVCSVLAYELLVVGVYGPRLGFARAVLRWGQGVEALCAPLEPCSSPFKAAVVDAQHKLMTWCIGDYAAKFYPVDVPTKAQYAEVKAAAAAAAARDSLGDAQDAARREGSADDVENSRLESRLRAMLVGELDSVVADTPGAEAGPRTGRTGAGGGQHRTTDDELRPRYVASSACSV